MHFAQHKKCINIVPFFVFAVSSLSCSLSAVKLMFCEISRHNINIAYICGHLHFIQLPMYSDLIALFFVRTVLLLLLLLLF